MTDFGVILLYAVIAVGGYILIPILLALLIGVLAVAGFIVSMSTKEKWK